MLSRCTRVLHRVARRLPRRHLSTLAESSESVQEQFDPANPTAEHRALRKMVQEFTKNEVEPQALQYNREERFNRALFERAGELGLCYLQSGGGSRLRLGCGLRVRRHR